MSPFARIMKCARVRVLVYVYDNFSSLVRKKIDPVCSGRLSRTCQEQIYMSVFVNFVMLVYNAYDWGEGKNLRNTTGTRKCLYRYGIIGHF